MGFEFQILDKLQTIHTPLLDRFMVAITKLGDAGIVWIILTVILLLIPKTRKSGVYMAVALIADLIICNVILKPIVARIRPYSINQTVQLLVTPLKDYSFHRDIQLHHLHRSVRCILREEREWQQEL